MACSSGANNQQQGLGSANSSFNGKNNNSVHGEWGVPTFQHQQTIAMEWTPEEQAKLEDGLALFASESNIIRYAKIAVTLHNKTVRDVALRCRWMTKKEISKKRKEETNARKIKDRKETAIDCPGNPTRGAFQLGSSSHAPGNFPNGGENFVSYKDEVSGVTQQLLQQNAWAFKQISANLATHQIHENIGLLSKARDNIFQIMANLNEMAPTMKKLDPLPLLDERLANSILPPSNFPVRL